MRARYILGEILTGLWRNIAMVISVVIVTAVSLTFVGTGVLMQKQIMDMKSTLVEQSQVTIFLCSPHSTASSCAGGAATDAQIDSVREALEGEVLSPYIASVEERDQEEALAGAREDLGIRYERVDWFSAYRVHHRVAARFRLGPVFLAGDAAHVHSPVGGQGMNTGLQDAYNLGWKLALAVSGKADAALLDSYNAERLPVAQRLLATTDRAFKLVVADNWIAGLLRTKVIARIAAFAMSIHRIRSKYWPKCLMVRRLVSGGSGRRTGSGLPKDLNASLPNGGSDGRGTCPERRD